MITLMVVVCRNLTARGRGACNIAPTCINWGTHLESLCTTVHALNVHPMCTQCTPNVHQVGERESGGLPWSHCAPLCKNWGPTSQCWIHPPSVVAGLRLHWGLGVQGVEWGQPCVYCEAYCVTGLSGLWQGVRRIISQACLASDRVLGEVWENIRNIRILEVLEY